jgi:hypothetical protein
MDDAVRQFIKNCLQCIKLMGGDMMPRPMGHQLTATQPMEVVATDFVKIGRSRHGLFLYILLILCQLTRLCLMVPTKDCTALTAARIFHER